MKKKLLAGLVMVMGVLMFGIINSTNAIPISFDSQSVATLMPAHSPEPAIMLLFGAGLVCLAALKRRRMR